MTRGLFLTFEGIEGCGKSTQLRRLAEWLEARGIPVTATREPGGTPLGVALRRHLLDPGAAGVTPAAELFLYLADRAQHVHETILPALRDGRTVLCDRHADATVVYQGIARGIGRAEAMALNRIATGGLVPDRTFLLDLPVETGLRRVAERLSGDRGATSRMDEEPREFHEAVRGGYLDLAREEPGRIRVIDATGAEEAVHRRIRDALSPLLEEKGLEP